MEERIKRLVNADRGVSQEFRPSNETLCVCVWCVCVCVVCVCVCVWVCCVCVCLSFNEKEFDVKQN